LTNAFSNKLDMKAAVSLHFAHYNYVRVHKSLRTTTAMAAGIEKTLWLKPKCVIPVTATGRGQQ
jgi:hypothetical protein